MLRIESWLVGWLARLPQVFVVLSAFEGLTVAPKHRAHRNKSALGLAYAPSRHSSWGR